MQVGDAEARGDRLGQEAVGRGREDEAIAGGAVLLDQRERAAPSRGAITVGDEALAQRRPLGGAAAGERRRVEGAELGRRDRAARVALGDVAVGGFERGRARGRLRRSGSRTRARRCRR